MRSALFIIFLSALLCKLSTSQIMPYQSHSFNDLEYVIQHLVKGVDSFKIDINSIERTTCETYSTWKDGDNNCESDNYNTEICCIGLRGDCSSSPRLNDYFNTTNDLLAFLNNTKYDYIWQKQNRIAEYNRTIYIAMNVQFTYVQSTVAKSWLSKMIQTIQQRDLDIKLVMGNPPDMFTYYAGICYNQSKDCDDEAKIIADYPFILQGYNDTRVSPFGLLENFNTNFSMIPHFCSNGFPSFGDPMPYYFYEVAHETDIQYILNAYSSPTCKRSQTHPDISTVRVTSNIDPEMFQNYMPKANPLGDLTDATNILVETYQQDQLIFLVYLDSKNITHVQLRSLTSPLQVVSQQQISGGVYTKVAYKAPYLLLQGQAEAQVFSVTNSPSLALQSLFNITSPGIAVDLVSYNNNVYLVQVDNQGCQAGSLVFVLADLSTGKQLVSQCSESIKAFDITKIQSADVAVGLDSSNTLHGVLFVSISDNTGPLVRSTIYSFSLSINIQNPQTFTIVIPTSYLDFGVDPTVKIVQDNGTFYVLEAHSNGLCQCADFINNGNMFKCGLSNTSNLHVSYLQNVPYLMNYNWGRLDDFTDRIQNGKYVNSCDQKIMHAKFYNGEAPSGTVFRNSTSGALQALFVNQYVDYKDLAFLTKLFCGATMPSNQGDTLPAAVANSFNILDFSLFNYL